MPKTDLAAQAKAIQGRKNRQAQAKRAKVAVVQPTPERLAMGTARRAGMATQFERTFDKLGLTDSQHAKLCYYREQAQLAQRSPSRDSCDFSVRGGSGNGPSMAILSAMSETNRLEAQMGPIRDMVRFIVVDDNTVRHWCIHRFGGQDSGGRIRPVNEQANKTAAIEALKAVADRMKINSK